MQTEVLAIAVNAVVAILGYVLSSKNTQYRIEQLEKKVEQHNNIIHRTYILETKVDRLEKERE